VVGIRLPWHPHPPRHHAAKDVGIHWRAKRVKARPREASAPKAAWDRWVAAPADATSRGGQRAGVGEYSVVWTDEGAGAGAEGVEVLIADSRIVATGPPRS
jgi:phage tail tape-measure protein